MKFITEAENSKSIANLLKEAKVIKCAVAFLGGNAPEYFKGKKKGDVQIICDLTSGSTNPLAVEELQKLIGPNNIRHLDGLHSKVYWTPGASIVGSANLSANGLGLEDEEITGTIEAGIYTTDYTLNNIIEDWFERKWSAATEISEKMISEAKILRHDLLQGRIKRRRSTRTIHLIEALCNNKKLLKNENIYFVTYRDLNVSKKAELEGNKFIKHLGYNERKIGWYEGWTDIKNYGNSILIDIPVDNNEVYFDGIWKTDNYPEIHHFKYNNGKWGEIALVHKVKEFNNINLAVNKNDIKLICEKMQPWAKKYSDNVISAYDATKYFK